MVDYLRKIDLFKDLSDENFNHILEYLTEESYPAGSKIIEAGKIMDIQVFDHLIIAGNNYLSFVEKRLI